MTYRSNELIDDIRFEEAHAELNRRGNICSCAWSSSHGKVTENLGLNCEGLVEFEAKIDVSCFYQCTLRRIHE